MIGILDYGCGNVMALLAAFGKIGVPAKLITEPGELCTATHIVVPGVGAFDHCCALMEKANFVQELNRLVLEELVPVLGICVGMQMMFEGSDEGNVRGLGWLKGRVEHLVATRREASLPVPHIGWNLSSTKSSRFVFGGEGIKDYFYFSHSYAVGTSAEGVAAITKYGCDFASVVQTNNIFGVQFHPERSHDAGLHLLKQFAAV